MFRNCGPHSECMKYVTVRKEACLLNCRLLRLNASLLYMCVVCVCVCVCVCALVLFIEHRITVCVH